MATKAAFKRLTKEYQQIQKDPPEFAIAKPSERNILEWHYVITGPPDSPYHDGQYYGTLHFPADYPFKPPAIKMCTPSGRFQCNTRLCLSISDFHPKSWNPSWQVSTILTGLVSFMTSEEITTGGVSTSAQARQGYAKDSRQSNLGNSTFCREFPELVETNKTHVWHVGKASKPADSVSNGVAASQASGAPAPSEDTTTGGGSTAAPSGGKQVAAATGRSMLWSAIGVVVALVILSHLFA